MRAPVPKRRIYTLLNHGPTVLLTASHSGLSNVMAVSWIMPIEIDPPKLIVALSDCFTRRLVLDAGEFAISIPPIELADAVYAVGTTSGLRLDKFEASSLRTIRASQVSAPLIEGCLGWIECRVLLDRGMLDAYDLIIAEMVTGWVDDQTYADGCFQFSASGRGTLHHATRGRFFTACGTIEVNHHDDRKSC